MLDEFELDSVESILRDKEYSIDKLNNYRIAIIAHEDSMLDKYILKMFEIIGKRKNVFVKVIKIASLSNINEQSSFVDKCEEEFGANEYNSIIYTGIIEQEYINRIDHKELSKLKEKLDRVANGISHIANKYNISKVVCVSDYKAYGNSKNRSKVSEYEIMPDDGSDIASVGESIRYMEQKMLKFRCLSSDVRVVVLRIGTLIAPYIKCNNSEVNRIINAIIENEEIKVERTLDKVSCIYINDLLRSICYALTEFKTGIYNIEGIDSSVTTGELVEILYNNFSDRMKIQLVTKQVHNEEVSKEHINMQNMCKLVELNCSKIKYAGFESTVNLEDALVLMIKSRIDKDSDFVFDNTYQGKLDTIHEILLGLVLEIDKICKKNNIKYFLAGGTLLGAIRHGAFIPWDDDVDVMMLRDDYEKFLKVAKEELPEWLFFQTPKTDKASHSVFTRIRINDTMFATKFTSRFDNMHNGIFLDVVCHDKTSNSKIMQKVHVFLTLLTRSMVFNKWKKAPIRLGDRFKVLCMIATGLKNILPMKLLEFIQDKTIAMYKYSKKSKYLYDGMGRNIRRGAFPSYYLDEVIEIDFKGKKLPVPKEYDKYLTYLYGDYMKMVPVSERRTSHSIEIMDLGQYIDYKVK